MTKTYTMNEKEYTVSTCTAIALCDVESEEARQSALLVSTEENGEKFGQIVFGWTMPESVEDFADMCEDSAAWESLCEEHHANA